MAKNLYIILVSFVFAACMSQEAKGNPPTPSTTATVATTATSTASATATAAPATAPVTSVTIQVIRGTQVINAVIPLEATPAQQAAIMAAVARSAMGSEPTTDSVDPTTVPAAPAATVGVPIPGHPNSLFWLGITLPEFYEWVETDKVTPHAKTRCSLVCKKMGLDYGNYRAKIREAEPRILDKQAIKSGEWFVAYFVDATGEILVDIPAVPLGTRYAGDPETGVGFMAKCFNVMKPRKPGIDKKRVAKKSRTRIVEGGTETVLLHKTVVERTETDHVARHYHDVTNRSLGRQGTMWCEQPRRVCSAGRRLLGAVLASVPLGQPYRQVRTRGGRTGYQVLSRNQSLSVGGQQGNSNYVSQMNAPQIQTGNYTVNGVAPVWQPETRKVVLHDFRRQGAPTMGTSAPPATNPSPTYGGSAPRPTFGGSAPPANVQPGPTFGH